MTIMPLIQGMQATNLAYASAVKFMGVNQQRMALANSVTGNESPAELVSVAAMDKALTLQGAAAQTNYLVAQAMLANAAKRREQDRELKERLRQAGAIFV